MQAADLQRKLKPRSKRARRILEKREPKLVRRPSWATARVAAEHVWRALLTLGVHTQVEDLKKSLLLFGGHTSQVTKDVLRDFRKLKGVRPDLRSALPGSALDTLTATPVLDLA
jgi:alkyl hydroperoxide reductase subunit AhpF